MVFSSKAEIQLLSVHMETCIEMFIAALFAISKHWEQLRFPPAGEGLDKLWYVYSRYHSGCHSEVPADTDAQFWRLKSKIEVPAGAGFW